MQRRRKRQIAIDLGSSRTRIFTHSGLVYDQSTAVLYDRKTGELLAVGDGAVRPESSHSRSKKPAQPIKRGLIVHAQQTEDMLTHAIRTSVSRVFITKPDVMINISLNATSAQKRALLDVGRKIGFGDIHFIENPMAAAFGAGVPILNPLAHGVLDIGYEKTEFGVFSHGQFLTSGYLGYGSKEILKHLSNRLEDAYDASFGEQSVTDALRNYRNRKTQTLTGVDEHGKPVTITVNSSLIEQQLQAPLKRITRLVTSSLRSVSPDVVADMAKSGIATSGTIAQFTPLEKLLDEQIGLPTFCAPDSSNSVVKGAHVALSHYDEFARLTN